MVDPLLIGFAVALGIGLLIGTERERRKDAQAGRASAGLRTFAITSLAGATAIVAGGPLLLGLLTFGLISLIAVAYWANREPDRGLTTEIALVLTCLLGGLAIEHPQLSAGGAVAAAVLLAARSWLHRFAKVVLTEAEMRDGLILAAATFIVLPLLPDQPVDPFGALNARSIWKLVVLNMGISAFGYVAVRALGRFGQPIAGFASGFISSTATIAAMGASSRKAKNGLDQAVAGAVLSTVATVIQLAVVLSATSTSVLYELAPALCAAGLVALGYAAIFVVKSVRHSGAADPQRGHAFDIGSALIFASVLTVVLLASAISLRVYGNAGVLIATALGGLVDVHSPAIATAALVANGHLPPADAELAIVVAFATNTLSKITVAIVTGGMPFAIRVIPGVILVAAAFSAIALLFGPFSFGL